MTLRFNNLTVARLAAALLVFLHHATAEELESLPSPHLLRFCQNGYVGVSFFFIVSGFVLAASNLAKLSTFSFRGTLSFYWKRIARIVPLWLVVSSPFIVEAVRSHNGGLLPFLTLTQAWSPDVMVAFGLLAVSWTLSVEMFFYLLFPFIAKAVGVLRGPKAGFFVTSIGIAISIFGTVYFLINRDVSLLPASDPRGPHHLLYRFPISRLGEFLVGIGIFLLIDRKPFCIGVRPSTVLLATALVGFLVTTSTIYPVGPFMIFPNALFLAVIVFMLAKLETHGFAVRSPTLILLGESSFAFYLVHQFYIRVLIGPKLFHMGGPFLSGIGTLAFALSTSVGLFLLIETPCRELLLRLVRVRSTIPEAEVHEDGVASVADAATQDAVTGTLKR